MTPDPATRLSREVDGPPARRESLTMIERIMLVLALALIVAVAMLWNTAGNLDKQQQRGINETLINREIGKRNSQTGAEILNQLQCITAGTDPCPPTTTTITK